MSLEIVTGRSKSGKSKYIYDTIERLAKEGKEVMLIVPEQYTHAAEKKLLSRVDAIKDNLVEVFSFNRLSQITEKRLGFPSRQIADSVTKALVIDDILKNNEFEFYRNCSGKTGFVDMIASTIGEFKKYMLLPETLVKASDDAKDEILSMKLRDLSLIYKSYEEAILKKSLDADDCLTLLASRLLNSDIYKDKYVFFDEFSTFVPQEISVIKALNLHAKSVCVSLCLDENEKNKILFMPTIDTFNRLTKCGGGNVKHTKLLESKFASQELSFLEKNLFAFPHEKYNGTCENIKIYSLRNPLSEVEVCAQNICALIREKGHRFGDIGVIMPDIDAYAGHIERVFDYNAIEYFIDNKNDIINHHIIRFVLSLLECYIYDYSYASIFNYLKAAFLNADSKNVALMQKYILKTNIKRTTWLIDEKWNKLLDANFADDEISKKALCEIRDKYVLPLAKMHEKIKGRHTVKENVTALYDLILELKLADTIAKNIDSFTNQGELRYAKQYEKIWDILVSVFDDMVELKAEDKVNVKEFYDMLFTAFSQHKVGFIPSSTDRVLVGNTERTRTEGLKVLFVLGVNEGLFPVCPKADGVLVDADKNLLKDVGVEFSTTSSVAAFYSQFSAYSAFTMPEEKLIISYPKSDNDFKTLRKSYIIDRVQKIFSLKEISESSIEDREFLTCANSAEELLCSNIDKFHKNIDIDPIWKSVYKYFADNTNFADKINYFLETDNIARNLSEKNLKQLISILSYTSVSKLERYMACKYSYFIDYILRIEAPREPTVDALDIGNITHAVLEILSKEVGQSRASFASVTDEYILNRTEELVMESLEKFMSTKDEITEREKFAITRLKNSIFICFKTVQSQFANSLFEPLGYEIEFSDKSPLGCIDIKTDDGHSVKLTGKIDRADIFETDGKAYVRVVDYKTGSKEFKLDDVLYGLSLQLMVYLNKLVSVNDKYTYGGALYFHVTNPIVKTDSPTDNESIDELISKELMLKGIVPYDERLLQAYEDKIASSLTKGTSKKKRVSMHGFEIIDKYLNKKIGSICSDILKGDISISPTKKNNYVPCSYCPYGSICRFDPSEEGNSYNVYSSKNEYEDILKEMEEAIDVDTKPTDCD